MYRFLTPGRALHQLALDHTINTPKQIAIQLAILSGNNMTLIKLHSDHLSDAIMVYANVEPEKRNIIASSMIAALDMQ